MLDRSNLERLNQVDHIRLDGNTGSLPNRMTRIIEAIVARSLDMKPDAKNTCLSGSAGTGKSVVIRNVAQMMNVITKRPVVVLAPTGIAAEVVDGETIHQYFQIKVHESDKVFEWCDKYGKEIDGKFPKHLTEIIEYNIKEHDMSEVPCLIIIDEISMVRADMFDHIIKPILQKQYAHIFEDGKAQMRHIPVLVCGDFFQLPPILKDYESENDSQEAKTHRVLDSTGTRSWPTTVDKLLSYYPNAQIADMKKGDPFWTENGRGGYKRAFYAFESHYWAQCNFKYFELDEPLRQADDTAYFDALQVIRESETFDYEVRELLASMFERNKNGRRVSDLSPRVTHIYAQNIDVAKHNFRVLTNEDFATHDASECYVVQGVTEAVRDRPDGTRNVMIRLYKGCRMIQYLDAAKNGWRVNLDGDTRDKAADCAARMLKIHKKGYGKFEYYVPWFPEDRFVLPVVAFSKDSHVMATSNEAVMSGQKRTYANGTLGIVDTARINDSGLVCGDDRITCKRANKYWDPLPKSFTLEPRVYINSERFDVMDVFKEDGIGKDLYDNDSHIRACVDSLKAGSGQIRIPRESMQKLDERARYWRDRAKASDATPDERCNGFSYADVISSIGCSDRMFQSEINLVTMTFTQFPLTLAYAFTVNKAQGQTFGTTVIHPVLGNGDHAFFSKGSMYTAISRCESIDNLYLADDVDLRTLQKDLAPSLASAAVNSFYQFNVWNQDFETLSDGVLARLSDDEVERNVAEAREALLHDDLM